MIIKGEGLYKDEVIHTKKQAVEYILYCMNTYQSKWNIRQVDDLLDEFNIKKEDFQFYEMSYHYGIFRAFYRPHHTKEEIEIIRKKCEELYAFDLIKNLFKDIGLAKKEGMTYDYISKYFNLDDLRQASIYISKYLVEKGD